MQPTKIDQQIWYMKFDQNIWYMKFALLQIGLIDLILNDSISELK
jgi:hypothetical protein